MGAREWKMLSAAALCASIVGFAACSGRNGNRNDTTTAATSSGEVARPGSTATPAASSAPGSIATTPSTASSTGANMSITGGDAEIVQVLAVVDHGEVQDGQLAERQAHSSQVKSYARELVSDHSKSLSEDRQLAKTVKADLSTVLGTSKSGTTGRDSSKARSDTSTGTPSASGTTGGVAGQLMSMHTQAMDQVRQQKGAAFDSAFVAAEVQGHQQVLDLLQRSQSQAQNSAVQQHLTTAIKGVQEHLDRGQKLQQSLASGTPGMKSDSGSKSGMKSDSTSKSKSKKRSDTTSKG